MDGEKRGGKGGYIGLDGFGNSSSPGNSLGGTRTRDTKLQVISRDTGYNLRSLFLVAGVLRGGVAFKFVEE